ncbi:MAG TPA: L-histidine N(alpha)-methyltransferase [Terriglobales bacterium]|nr:L-histidine N(alpha)-methyltransferase [Terriglobales bacterium]
MATQLANTYSMSDMAWEVRAGLTDPSQKELPSKYLYDEVGSALFEVICALPEYGLARADERLLRRHSHDIIARLRCPVVVAELGSGTGKKTRRILEALTRQQRTSYFPIEISASALAMCKRELGDIDRINIVGCEREYLDGLREAVRRRRPEEQMLVLFLGSTIGNFDHPAEVEFLQRIRYILQPGDALLLGTDLEKPTQDLLLAYDDPIGVTAAFDLNLLARLNRELEANFELSNFKHVARYNSSTGSVEMHLESLQKQRVEIPAAELSVVFEEGETIWTESSHKYSLAEVQKIAKTTGFRGDQQWVDEEWPFAESLLIAE